MILFFTFQDPVQLWGAVDEGPEVHADQPEVGAGLGLLAVRQQAHVRNTHMGWARSDIQWNLRDANTLARKYISWSMIYILYSSE